MNPKSINDLDPKLREAYEKVMGTTLTRSPSPAPAAHNPPDNAQTPTQPVQEAAAQPQAPLMQTAAAEQQTAPTIQTIPVQPPAPVNPTPSPLPSDNPFVQTPEPPPTVFTQTQVTARKSRKLSVLPVLFVVGGLAFFAAYVFIWAKVFGLL